MLLKQDPQKSVNIVLVHSMSEAALTKERHEVIITPVTANRSHHDYISAQRNTNR